MLLFIQVALLSPERLLKSRDTDTLGKCHRLP